MTDELLNWYDKCARTLPWRGIHDAYRTWVSEIMLQQTRVDTVIPYYYAFLSEFPDVVTLAGASEDAVLKQWQGLGYYSRARNLHKGAKQIVCQYGGVLPSDPDQLLKICGIGRYTAGAIASIAYNIPVTAVDGNVIRVFSRLAGIEEDASLPSTLEHIDILDRQYMNELRPGDYNQALMDLGATVCVPGTPDCDHCPLKQDCVAFHTGHPEFLPNLPGRKPPRPVDLDVFLITDGSSVLVSRRTEKMLEGLWVFPVLDGHLELSEIPSVIMKKWKADPKSVSFAGTAKHVFTHQIWQMNVWFTHVDKLVSSASATSVYLSELSTLAIPTAMRIPLKYLKQICVSGEFQD